MINSEKSTKAELKSRLEEAAEIINAEDSEEAISAVDESFSDALGDNSHPEQDIPEAHMPDENEAWTDEDFKFYFPNGEITQHLVIELTSEELGALNEYLARKESEMWYELNEIRARQKYPLVVVKKVNVPPEDMMLYGIGIYDSYEEMKNALDKNFEMVSRCKDETDMRYLFYTCDMHTVYMMLKARGYETRFSEWRSIKENVVSNFIQQELARREKILKHEIISKNREEIIKMLNKYADIRGTICAIRNGIKTFRKGIRMRVKQGLPSEGLESAIHSAKEEYRELRREGFSLRWKLLRVMSASEIRRACEAYIARCEEIRRRHMRK